MEKLILNNGVEMPILGLGVFGLEEENSIVNTLKGNFSGTKVVV